VDVDADVDDLPDAAGGSGLQVDREEVAASAGRERDPAASHARAPHRPWRVRVEGGRPPRVITPAVLMPQPRHRPGQGAGQTEPVVAGEGVPAVAVGLTVEGEQVGQQRQPGCGCQLCPHRRVQRLDQIVCPRLVIHLVVAPLGPLGFFELRAAVPEFM
jgi:hypothetical protein